MTSYITATLTSDSNIEYLNEQIIKKLSTRNIDIVPQNTQKMKDLVYYIHNEWFNDQETRYHNYTIDEILNIINKKVIEYAVRDIETNFYAAKRYQNSLNTLPVPNSLPVSTSTIGIKLPENIHPN